MHDADGVAGGGGVVIGFKEAAGGVGVPEFEVREVDVDETICAVLLVGRFGSGREERTCRAGRERPGSRKKKCCI